MKRIREIEKEREKVKGKQRLRGREKELKQTERKIEIKGAKRVQQRQSKVAEILKGSERYMDKQRQIEYHRLRQAREIHCRLKCCPSDLT